MLFTPTLPAIGFYIETLKKCSAKTENNYQEGRQVEAKEAHGGLAREAMPEGPSRI